MNPKRAGESALVLQAHPPVVRVGDTVRRPSSGAAVHALLAYLEQVGFPYSPRLLGVDKDGREVLTYLSGRSGRLGWAQIVPDKGLRAFAQLLRAYHDAVADFVAPVDEWPLEPRPRRSGELVCHGDFGPWNVVWDGERPVGLLDFDLARPAPPLTDIAHALEYSVPFRADDECLRWLATAPRRTAMPASRHSPTPTGCREPPVWRSASFREPARTHRTRPAARRSRT